MLNKFFSSVLAILIGSSLYSQSYTVAEFSYDSIMNISYGNSLNYANESEELFFDLYKPKGDNNCKRPIVVLIHGGAWVAGSKEDVDLVYMSRYFAKRGYVVANMNYRMGMNKPSNWSLYALCDPALFSPCAYIADSSEVYRANYRGMQDAKGLIRYMKSRNDIDSTDIDNVYLIGESAGGFIALQTALMQEENQKPINCGAIGNAPNPDPDFASYSCNGNGYVAERGDLGSVEGELHMNGYDASVKGVGNFFGGILDASLITSNASQPYLYLFHQGSDIIVHYNYGKLLGRTSYECFAAVNLCQPYYFFPNAYGSKGIKNLMNTVNNTNYTAEIIENFEYQNDCFDNGHSIDFIETRLTNLNSDFASIIVSSGNDPAQNCTSLVSSINSTFSIYPNPVESVLHFGNSTGVMKRIYTIQGELVGETMLEEFNCSGLSTGLYFVRKGNTHSKFVKI
jgi:Carboxylesterase family